MNQREISQNADFLSIALEEYRTGNTESAKEFVDDVRTALVRASRDDDAEKLQKAIDRLNEGMVEESREIVQEVYEGLLEEYDE